MDAIENAIYSRQAPAATGAPQDSLAPPVVAVTVRSPRGRGSVVRAAPPLPTVRLLAGVPGLPGEGAWRPLGVGGQLEATWVRADRRHLPVVASAVLVRRGTLQLHLAPGTLEPSPGAFPIDQTKVPTAALGHLVADFNAGFKTADSRGGWQLGSRTIVPLVPGRASLVIDTHGGWSVGAWGAGVGPGRDVAAVRQNLDLIVDGGQPVPRLTSNQNGRWGSARTQLQYTSRSGLGVTATGDLVYVTGRSMTLAVLAEAMARLGVVTGMEMDEHPTMVGFNVVTARKATGPILTKLVTTMKPAARRYLVADQRDFLYLTTPGS